MRLSPAGERRIMSSTRVWLYVPTAGMFDPRFIVPSVQPSLPAGYPESAVEREEAAR
ncbi:hypothetical protein GCM10025773_18120 [Microbacterium jejuense]